jgi:ABC-2 type transport system ATP-binding protein
MEKVISILNFSKSFGKTTVIKDLSFDVHKGEIFAFLGANGSGKTTTLRALLQIYQPDNGTLLVKGKPYSVDRSHLIGYLPEERGLYVTSKVLETMIFFGQLKDMSYHAAKEWSIKYLDEVGLADKQNVEIKKLSSGQQQKIQLGITIINTPEILILDEPTKGLDPVNRQLLMDILFKLNKEHKTTIVFSTHMMDEVERIADRLVIIKDGIREAYGNVEDVKKEYGENIVKIKFTGDFTPNEKLYAASVQKNYAELTPKDGISQDQILKDLVKQDLLIHKFEVSSPSLNEVFIKISKNNIEGNK